MDVMLVVIKWTVIASMLVSSFYILYLASQFEKNDDKGMTLDHKEYFDKKARLTKWIILSGLIILCFYESFAFGFTILAISLILLIVKVKGWEKYVKFP